MKIKKLFAMASAVVMMATATTVPAMAAVLEVRKPIKTTNCFNCGNSFTLYPNNGQDETIADYFDLSDYSALQSALNNDGGKTVIINNASASYCVNNDCYIQAISDLLGDSYLCFDCIATVYDQDSNTPITPDDSSTVSGKSGSTNLTASVASGYTISIPQSVTLSGSSDGSGIKSATIPVLIKGDISEEANVVVTTEAPTMKRTGSKDVTATVTEPDKTTWSRTACAGDGTKRNYTVSANLTPGDWKGTMTFNCSLGVLTEVNFGIACLGDDALEFPYTVNYGITWEQWVNSDKNTYGFTISNGKVMYPSPDNDRWVHEPSTGKAVSPTDLILPDTVYGQSYTITVSD